MTPSIHKGNKQMIFCPDRIIRIYHTPQAKVDKAVAIVRSALDRQLPFAYKTIKPMYYLMPVDRHNKIVDNLDDQYYYIDQDKVKHRSFILCESMDMKAKAVMTSNYYKLKDALRLLHDEGYVKTYWVLNDNPSFRCVWYVDNPDEPLEYETMDYGSFPPDYEHIPNKNDKRYLRYREKKRQMLFDNSLKAMREAFPLDDLPNAKVYPEEKQIKFDHEQIQKKHLKDYSPVVMLERELDNSNNQKDNRALYIQGRELREWYITFMAQYCEPKQLGEIINEYI